MTEGALLIADDDADFVDVLAARFKALGYRVLTARDGDVALRVFMKERPAVVLMDVHMPNVDGLLALREMLESEPEAKVIAMTGLPDDRTARLMVEAGACDFLVKPFDLLAAETSVAVSMIAASGVLPSPSKSTRPAW